MSNFKIRSMSRPEFDLALDWAAAEGWNPGLFDAEPFYAIDPEGLLIGMLGKEPVAVISVARYGASFGFLGFYIVKPGFRGQGYGWRIWQAGMQHLGQRNIGLDGVLAQQDNYRRSGFQLAHRNVRYQSVQGGPGVGVLGPLFDVDAKEHPNAELLGAPASCRQDVRLSGVASGGAAEDAGKMPALPKPPLQRVFDDLGHRSGFMRVNLPAGTGLTPLSALPLDALAAYDRSFFPADRREFLQLWISQPQTVALAVLGDAGVRGYGVRRSCRSGYKIGPLFADTPELATALFDGLCAGTLAGQPIFLDVPECNPAALALAQARGMQKVFETARMYTGAQPDLALPRTYGITSFELG